ncbi:unnamed protein product, partial [Discosporangium mesarthrocarpum]
HQRSAPPPPPRALELVKDEIQRALHQFSSTPLKGYADPPSVSDLLRPFDIARDGKVTYSDFKVGLRGLGLGLTESEAQELARFVDKEETGLVDRQLFEGMLQVQPQQKELKWSPELGQDQGHDNSSAQGGGSGTTQRHGVKEQPNLQNPPRGGQGQALASSPIDHTEQMASAHLCKRSCLQPPPHMQPRPPPLHSTHFSRSTVSFKDWQQMSATGTNPATPRSAPESRSGGKPGLKEAASPVSQQTRASLRTLLERKVDQGSRKPTINQSYQRGKRDKGIDTPADDGQCPTARDGTRTRSCNLRPDDGMRGRAQARRGRDKERTARPHSVPASGRASGRSREQGSGPGGRSKGEEEGGRVEGVRLNWQQEEDANRAESILYHKSKGNVMGLRRALAGFDPSGSGVVTPGELSVAVLRFGAGLDKAESHALAARYKRSLGRAGGVGELGGVDYGHLADTLEARAAGFLDGSKQKGEISAEGSQRFGSSERPARSAGVPGGGWTRGSGGGEGGGLERSQLARRACSKALALLDQHGTRNVDSVFRLVHPSCAEGINAEQLRQSMCILAGGDPLSDVEHHALFQVLSGEDGWKVNHRELGEVLRRVETNERQRHLQQKAKRELDHCSHSSRDWPVHFRHSNVIDWQPPSSTPPTYNMGGPESRRDGLIYQRVCDSVRGIQERSGSMGLVYNIFHPPANDNTSVRPPSPGSTTEAIPHHVLRSRLSSLGVPLGDEDFASMLAHIDPTSSGRGYVSYQDFCRSMRLHHLGEKINLSRSSASRNRSKPSDPLVTAASTTAAVGSESPPSGLHLQSGPARRHALALSPSDDLTLDGGILHHNPATAGCPNPNFTTTMTGGGRGDGRSRYECELGRATSLTRSGSCNGRTWHYRPKRHQSPAPAPAAQGTGRRPGSQGQTVMLGEEVNVNSWGGGWLDSADTAAISPVVGTGCGPSPPSTDKGFGGQSSTGYTGTSPTGAAAAPQPHALGVRSGWGMTPLIEGNRRGRGEPPPDNDLGFGSDRIVSNTRHHGRATCHLHAMDSGPDNSAKRRPRSLSLGAEQRYGHWAGSTLHELLRHDGCSHRGEYMGRYPARFGKPQAQAGDTETGTDDATRGSGIGGNKSPNQTKRHPPYKTQRT